MNKRVFLQVVFVCSKFGIQVAEFQTHTSLGTFNCTNAIPLQYYVNILSITIVQMRYCLHYCHGNVITAENIFVNE